jgi:hypothetical protein
MISYTFRHHTPSDTKHLGLPGGAAGAMSTYTDTSASCLSRPSGTYGQNAGISACDLCPAGQHTTSSGATASADCVERCSSAGHYLVFTGGSCQTSTQASAFEYKATREVDRVPRYGFVTVLQLPSLPLGVYMQCMHDKTNSGPGAPLQRVTCTVTQPPLA